MMPVSTINTTTDKMPILLPVQMKTPISIAGINMNMRINQYISITFLGCYFLLPSALLQYACMALVDIACPGVDRNVFPIRNLIYGALCSDDYRNAQAQSDNCRMRG